MKNFTYDVVILTEERYENPVVVDWYVEQVLLEDHLLEDTCKKLNLNTIRKNWNDQNFDWTLCNAVVFRSTWDYFHKFETFQNWLNKWSNKLQFINTKELINWNMHKGYLFDLFNKGIAIPKTFFVEKHNEKNLSEFINELPGNEFIIKPCISGAARNTFKISKSEVATFSEKFKKLNETEDYLIQEFQNQIVTKGEISLIFIGNTYCHSVLKKAKINDYRVQDDFGGTVHEYIPTDDEILFAKNVLNACPTLPYYSRVDLMWNNENELVLGELELIEPELWFRKNPKAAELLAKKIAQTVQNSTF